MISIITAIYNQLPMNRLYCEYLNRFTGNPFELIIVDNGSTDGSAEFFERHGARVIRNGGNYSYPRCQNRGIQAARYDVLVFLNNDLIVSPQWDLHALAIMDYHGLEIGSCCATDRTETSNSTRSSQRLWKYVRNPLLFLFGPRHCNLKLMLALRYGNWETWNDRRRQKFGNSISEGIAGSNVIMRRSALSKVGRWDERIQAADFDLAIRTKLRSIERKDIKPVHLLLGVYLHHYIRLTYKKRYPPFIDGANLIALNKKWDADRINPILSSSGMRVKKPKTS
ncbi:MAG: glycosyltransferase family 2 protein [Chitinispirillaceae bacterium]|nr:glycosyltransferase family 2 protein [Chitinispirillaceae bacterium]